MTVIQWVRQGGRRYTQMQSASVSAVGLAWASVGSGGAAPAALRGIVVMVNECAIVTLVA